MLCLLGVYASPRIMVNYFLLSNTLKIFILKINFKKSTKLHNLYFLSSLKATIKDYEKCQFYEQIYEFRT